MSGKIEMLLSRDLSTTALTDTTTPLTVQFRVALFFSFSLFLSFPPLPLPIS